MLGIIISFNAAFNLSYFYDLYAESIYSQYQLTANIFQKKIAKKFKKENNKYSTIEVNNILENIKQDIISNMDKVYMNINSESILKDDAKVSVSIANIDNFIIHSTDLDLTDKDVASYIGSNKYNKQLNTYFVILPINQVDQKPSMKFIVGISDDLVKSLNTLVLVRYIGATIVIFLCCIIILNIYIKNAIKNITELKQFNKTTFSLVLFLVIFFITDYLFGNSYIYI